MKQIIKFKKLHPDARVPVKAHDTDACYDCFAVSMKDHGNGVIEYDMGFAIEMPEGGRVDFRSRSSIYKTGLILCNGTGTVDQGYTNACRAFFYNIIKELPNYQPGDRICQMLFDFREDVKFVEVEEFTNENTDRGLGGFGSSGK